MSMVRTRWAAIGAALAVSLGAGGVGLSQAARSSGDRPVFVAIEPCRLVDTRPGDANIGPRATPLGTNDTLGLRVTGSTGQCADIPTDAVAAALNVTAIQGSTRSFLTVYPAGTPRPNASNLNWNGGDPPTPNKVDVKLSGDGSVSITNAAGTVHVAADLVGYYVDHTHDDRYYTKSQLDAARQVSRTVYAAAAAVTGGSVQLANNCVTLGSSSQSLLLPIDVPAGARITSVAARVIDGSANIAYSVAFQRLSPTIAGLSAADLRVTTAGAAIGGQQVELTPAGPVLVADGDAFAVELTTEQPTIAAEHNGLCTVTIEYMLPSP